MKIVRRILFVLIAVILIYGGYYASQALPILTGYSAKIACSCVMLAGREPGDVIKEELGSFPLSLGSVSVNFADSSASASLWGLSQRKAIYRKGLGCTLLSEINEEELRAQKINLPVPPSLDPDTIDWPAGDRTTPVTEGYDAQKLNAVIEDAFSEPGENKIRRTRAIIIVHKGKIIAEKYAVGFDIDSKLTGWSMSKSITNALVGILAKQGKLDVNQCAPIADWQKDSRKAITLNHLMQASSGLEWKEVYSGPSSATNMLFRKRDAGLFAAASPLPKEPGTDFYYSSGTTNIISRIVRNTVGDKNYYRFPYDELFYKIGMLNTVPEPDAGGTFVGSSFTFATARDWARFGLLFLNDGVWNGERILPEGWVKYTTTPAPAAERGEYGAQFWLNAGEKNNPANRTYPDVPTDLFWADGYEGQSVFILPSRALVVVKLSLSSGEYLDDNQFLSGIISGLD